MSTTSIAAKSEAFTVAGATHPSAAAAKFFYYSVNTGCRKVRSCRKCGDNCGGSDDDGEIDFRSLVGPGGWECYFGEPEDASWCRDGEYAMTMLNELAARVKILSDFARTAPGRLPSNVQSALWPNAFPASTTAPCRHCEGKGYTEPTWNFPGVARCHDCGGTGIIEGRAAHRVDALAG